MKLTWTVCPSRFLVLLKHPIVQILTSAFGWPLDLSSQLGLVFLWTTTTRYFRPASSSKSVDTFCDGLPGRRVVIRGSFFWDDWFSWQKWHDWTFDLIDLLGNATKQTGWRAHDALLFLGALCECVPVFPLSYQQVLLCDHHTLEGHCLLTSATHNKVFDVFYRDSIKTWKRWPNLFKFQSISILAAFVASDDRKQF